MIYKEIAEVVNNKEIAKGIYESVLLSPNIAKASNPGQFINILPCFDWKNVMRRPMSIASQNNNKISIEVILASHAHQVPQVGFPQIEPVTKAIILNTKPDGAKLLAIIEKFLFLKIKLTIERRAINEKIPRDVHAEGTCTYIILTE